MLEQNQSKDKVEMLELASAYQAECKIVKEEIRIFYKQDKDRISVIERELTAVNIRIVNDDTNLSAIEKEYLTLYPYLYDFV